MDMDCSKPLPPSPPHSPPAPPPRSPLRPPPRRPQPLHMSIATHTGPSSSTSSTGGDSTRESSSIESPVPLSASFLKQQQEQLPSPTTAQARLGKSALTKRQHALHELLSSERAYASDLALIKDVHIPLALGQPAAFHIPQSATKSGSNARTLSTASSSTTSSFASTASVRTTSTAATSAASVVSSTFLSSTPSLDGGPSPMTPADARIIFSNIADLAVFSDQFCDVLQDALGSEIDGGQGEDRVGKAFLAVVPDLEPPYKHYITKHSAALAHLTAMTAALPPASHPPASDSQSTLVPSSSRDTLSTTPSSSSTTTTTTAAPTPSQTAFANYLSLTRAIASTHTHAWDLPSLLIKPVQRLLKYPLLLQAVIDATPDTHPDYVHLKEAKSRMEEVARGVNEGRRRKEVVREILEQAKSRSGPFGIGVGGKGKGVSPSMSMESLGLGPMGFANVSGIGMGFIGPGGKKKNGLGKMKSLKGKSSSAFLVDELSHSLDSTTFTDSPSASNASSNSSTPQSSTPRPSISSASGIPPNPEAIAVAELAAQLEQTYAFLHSLASDAVAWTRAVKRTVEQLEVWARAFARVIGLRVEGDAPGGGSSSADSGGSNTNVPNEDIGGPPGYGEEHHGPAAPNIDYNAEEAALQSEAFDAFLNVVRVHLLPLSAALEPQLRAKVLAPAASLVRSMDEPKTIVNAMNAARPLHEHLLHTPISSSSSLTSTSKSRPSAQLLQASSTYLALRGQLHAELPTYVALLQRGVSAVLAEWVALQEGYYHEVQMRWAELWEMLRVEGEGNAGGAGETITVWDARWREVFELVSTMSITRPLVKEKSVKEKDKDRDKDKKRARSGSIGALPSVSGIVAGLDSSARSITSSRDGPSPSMVSGMSSVASMLASLDPALPHTGRQFSPVPLSPTSWNGGPGLPHVSGPLPLARRARGLSASDVVNMRNAHSDGSYYAEHYRVDVDLRRMSERERERELGFSAAHSAQSRRSSSRSRRGGTVNSADRSLVAAGGPGNAADLNDLGFGVGDPGFEEFTEHLARDRPYRDVGGHDHKLNGEFGHELDFAELNGEWKAYDEYAQMAMLDPASESRDDNVMPGDYDAAGDYIASGLPSSFSQKTPVSPLKVQTKPRTKSMSTLGGTPSKPELPSAAQNSTSSRTPKEEVRAREKDRGQDAERESRERERDVKDRGRSSRKSSLRRKLTDSLRSSHSSSGTQPQAGTNRHRSPSARSLNRETYFSVDPDAPPTPSSNANFSGTAPASHGNSYPSWTSAPAKYMCQVVHACHPPSGVSYFSYPFFTLVEGDIYEVLHEAGHPSMHPKLPLHVDDGADCLLLVRDADGVIGWALASFLIPLEDI